MYGTHLLQTVHTEMRGHRKKHWIIVANKPGNILIQRYMEWLQFPLPHWLEFPWKQKIPNYLEYSELVNSIQDAQLTMVMNAILKGVQTSFKKGKRPFVEITLPDKSAYSIGQFLQMKMMEMMYLGFLMNVNPFDQPNVEDYKIETKKQLKEPNDKLEGIIWKNITDIFQSQLSENLEDKIEEQLKEINKKIKLKPENLDLYYLKIRILIYFNQYQEAINLLDKILVKFPDCEKDIKLLKVKI